MRGLGRAIAVVNGLGIGGAPEAAEDLAADRVIPVAERAAHGTGACRPGATAKYLVFGPEEGLGVFPVGERLEAGISVEVAGGPFPHVPDHAITAERREV